MVYGIITCPVITKEILLKIKHYRQLGILDLQGLLKCKCYIEMDRKLIKNVEKQRSQIERMLYLIGFSPLINFLLKFHKTC